MSMYGAYSANGRVRRPCEEAVNDADGKLLRNSINVNVQISVFLRRHVLFSLYLHCEALICFTTFPVVARSYYLGGCDVAAGFATVRMYATYC